MDSSGPIRRARLEAVARGLVARPAFWLALVAALAAWPAAHALLAPRPAPPPVLAQAPGFELLDQGGRPFGSADLAGRVWVASFIFTRCVTVCPAVTRQMAALQARAGGLGDRFHLVSFTVDPERDGPEQLAAYARRHRANPRSWTFLTGTPAAIEAAVGGGFRLAMGTGASGEIFHDTHLVLVDGRGRVRGLYDSGDPDAVERVLRDAELLVNGVDSPADRGGGPAPDRG